MSNRMDRLYWVDSLLDQIGHISIEGTDRQTFTNIGQITQPYSLTVYSGDLTERMYFTHSQFFKCFCSYFLQPWQL